MSQDPVIVVRRRKKVSAKGHGSSAWKIAFADFTLSMMAVFLVLWVINMASPREQAIIGRYFSDPTSIFDEGGQDNMMTFGFDDPLMAASDQGESGQSSSPLWGLFQQLKEAGLSGVLGGFQDNIRLQLLPQGVLINISESKDRAMFKLGSDQLTPYFEDLILNLAPFLSRTNRAITITGHSDATRFRGSSRMNNWYLSANRANITRETLVFGGVPTDKVVRVSAMADSALLYPARPYNSANRRVEIMVLTPESERQLLGRRSAPDVSDKKSGLATRNILNQARQRAARNQKPAAS